MAVEAALSGPLGRPDLAQALRHVQLAEKEKLQLVRSARGTPTPVLARRPHGSCGGHGVQIADYQRAQQRWHELDAANDIAGGETATADEDESERADEDEDGDGTEVQLLRDAQMDARRCRQRCASA